MTCLGCKHYARGLNVHTGEKYIECEAGNDHAFHMFYRVPCDAREQKPEPVGCYRPDPMDSAKYDPRWERDYEGNLQRYDYPF